MILADEPTGALDTKSADNVRAILRELATVQGRSIIAVTHDMHFAEAADRQIEIVDGRIVAPPGAPGIPGKPGMPGTPQGADT